MSLNLARCKDWLYYYFAEKNWGVRREYGPYVDAHRKEHSERRWKHWLLLIRLNWHYRVLRKTELFIKKPVQQGNNKSIRLPYLDGSESGIIKRPRTIHLAKRLMRYDVISFDIFDTLILRPFAQPKDLFMIVGEKLGIMDFYNIRIKAEQDARNYKLLTEKNREVTIYDIYREIAKETGIDAGKGIETEIETEIEFCFANPYMKQVYNMVKDAGKDIVITSDMYLPGSIMKRLLDSCGYDGYSKLYVSCDFFCSKRDGGLYKVIKNDFINKAIVHIGDNIESDVRAAESNNILSVFYENCHNVGRKYRATGMSELIGSFYSGIVNTHLHNGTKVYSPEYEYGFIYGGLYIFGFCNWIYRNAKQDGVEKILFLARDGDIYQRVFNMMFNDMPNEYVYWSRIANLKANIKYSRFDFFNRVIKRRVDESSPYKLSEILSLMDLLEILPVFEKNGISGDTLVLNSTVGKIKNILFENWDKVIAVYQDKINITKKYLLKAAGNSRKIAVVDVGWVGTNVIGVKTLLEEVLGDDIEVKCYLAGTIGFPYHNTMYLMNGVIKTYLFARNKNREFMNSQMNTNKGLNYMIFEFFTQANSPSFAGFSNNGNFLFDMPEVSNYRITTAIHHGILDFCKLYYKFGIKEQYLFNISGYDAFSPFILVKRNLKLIKSIFQNYVVSSNIGTNKNDDFVETFNDQLIKKGIL